MDESDAFKREVDNAKYVLVLKLALISLMDREARIDDWSDRELMSRLALVSSLKEGKDEVVEGSDDGGGVDSKLAVILLPFIEVDADVLDMEVFGALEVAMVAAAAAAEAAAAMAAPATLRVALILICLFRIDLPIR